MNEQKKSPPKVTLTVRVGITGHRPKGLGSADDSNALKSRLDLVFKEIRRIGYKLREESSTLYSPEEPVFRIISPLAEGADMMAAEAAVVNDYELQCAIPFKREEYEKDFQSEDSLRRFRDYLGKAAVVFELNGSRRSRSTQNESYQAVGRMVLDHSDILIAIWDGKDARGKGGTGQVVEEAVQDEIPVIWIDSSPGHEIKIITGKDKKEFITDNLESLDNRLGHIFVPSNIGDVSIRDAYFHEEKPNTNPGVIFEVFCDIFSGDKIDASWLSVNNFEENTRNEWGCSYESSDKMNEDDMLLRGVSQQVDERLLLHYSWADNLAKYYSNVYRSSFVLNYLLAGLAVLFALLVLVDDSRYFLWIALEFIVITLILINTKIGNLRKWHERWIDYRLLSEELRQLRFLAPIGMTPPAIRVPAHDTHGDPRNTWVNWHFRSIVRELGLLCAKVDQGYIDSYNSLVLSREIDGQISYHEKNYPRYNKINSRLHKLGTILFLLTFVAVVVHVVLHHDVLTVFAAVLPAFGAAFYGIRTQAEFEQIAKRSHAMSARLKDIRDNLNSFGSGATYTDIALIAEETAEIISSETLDWRIVFQSKKLVLPA